MAPLSKALSGVRLPHDTCGSHLDSSRRTTDVELGKRNLQVAGEILSKIPGGLMFDNFPVFCEYVNDASLKSVPVDGLQATTRSLNISCRL